MTTALELVKRFEGYSATPYNMGDGVPTIGYGTTRYPDGRKVTLADAPCTEPQAAGWLQRDVDHAEANVLRLSPRIGLEPAYRTTALTSFVYNLGADAYRTSTLRARVAQQDWPGAEAEFGRWVYGGGKKLAGLVARRAAEAAVFMGHPLP